MALAQCGWNQCRNSGIHHEFIQRHLLDHQFFRQQIVNRLFRDPFACDDHFDHRVLALLLVPHQLLHLLTIKQAALVEQDCELAAVGDTEFRELLYLLGFVLIVALQCTVFLHQLILLKRERNSNAQVIVIPGFQNEFVDCTALDCADNGIDVRMPGQHDANHVWLDGACLPQQLSAIQVWHHVITDDELE